MVQGVFQNSTLRKDAEVTLDDATTDSNHITIYIKMKDGNTKKGATVSSQQQKLLIPHKLLDIELHPEIHILLSCKEVLFLRLDLSGFDDEEDEEAEGGLAKASVPSQRDATSSAAERLMNASTETDALQSLFLFLSAEIPTLHTVDGEYVHSVLEVIESGIGKCGKALEGTVFLQDQILKFLLVVGSLHDVSSHYFTVLSSVLQPSWEIAHEIQVHLTQLVCVWLPDQLEECPPHMLRGILQVIASFSGWEDVSTTALTAQQMKHLSLVFHGIIEKAKDDDDNDGEEEGSGGSNDFPSVTEVVMAVTALAPIAGMTTPGMMSWVHRVQSKHMAKALFQFYCVTYYTYCEVKDEIMGWCVEAARVHPSIEALQEICMTFLARCAMKTSNHTALIRCGSLQAATVALERYHEHIQIQHDCCVLFASLLASHSDSAYGIARHPRVRGALRMARDFAEKGSETRRSAEIALQALVDMDASSDEEDEEGEEDEEVEQDTQQQDGTSQNPNLRVDVVAARPSSKIGVTPRSRPDAFAMFSPRQIGNAPPTTNTVKDEQQKPTAPASAMFVEEENNDANNNTTTEKKLYRKYSKPRVPQRKMSMSQLPLPRQRRPTIIPHLTTSIVQLSISKSKNKTKKLRSSLFGASLGIEETVSPYCIPHPLPVPPRKPTLTANDQTSSPPQSPNLRMQLSATWNSSKWDNTVSVVSQYIHNPIYVTTSQVEKVPVPPLLKFSVTKPPLRPRKFSLDLGKSATSRKKSSHPSSPRSGLPTIETARRPGTVPHQLLRHNHHRAGSEARPLGGSGGGGLTENNEAGAIKFTARPPPPSKTSPRQSQPNAITNNNNNTTNKVDLFFQSSMKFKWGPPPIPKNRVMQWNVSQEHSVADPHVKNRYARKKNQ
eukprot:PhF_6_TR29435/c1_g1_i1/m.43579